MYGINSDSVASSAEALQWGEVKQFTVLRHDTQSVCAIYVTIIWPVTFNSRDSVRNLRPTTGICKLL